MRDEEKRYRPDSASKFVISEVRRVVRAELAAPFGKCRLTGVWSPNLGNVGLEWILSF